MGTVHSRAQATLLVASLLVLLVVARTAHAAAFTVNSTGDGADADLTNATCDVDTATAGDQCTLRAAIQEANDTPGTDTIGFDIPGTGVKTIAPASALPAATDPLTIDGTTQPGFSGSPVIELNGAGAGAGVDGLAITAGSSTVRGLVINRFSRHGILLQTGGGNTVAGNFIGTDATGAVALGNGFSGVRVNDSDNNAIGGTSSADGNVISGNHEGIRLDGSEESTVRGNRIGTDTTGTAAVGNFSTGVLLISASRCAVGGTAAGAGNTIAFNGPFTLDGGGVVVLSNGFNSILSNSIFSNEGLGIDLSAHFPLDGVTANDPDDTDSGPNGLQNFPVLDSATDTGGSTTIEGTLDSAPGGNFVVQFFSGPEPDPSGNGEGKTYLGQMNVATNAGGDASFAFTTPGAQAGEVVTATATGVNETGAPFFDTSEFSVAIEVTAPDTVAPRIIRLRPEPGARIQDRTPTIKATVRDATTELSRDDIKLYVDGRRKTRFSYDRKEDVLSRASGRLSFGRHNVRVVARDAAGNVASRTWGFKVVR